jgi:hypothetical protein
VSVFRRSILGWPILASPQRCLAPLVVALFLPAVAASPAQAQSIFGNFGVPLNPDTLTGTSIGTFVKSVRFSTGANSVSVTSVQASLSRQILGDPNTVRFGIFSNNGVGSPDTLLFGFNDQALTNEADNPQDITFTPTSAITLSPNTTYHLRLSLVSGNNALWFATNPAGTNPTAQNGSGMVFETYRISDDGGATYTNSSLTNRFQINGTVQATTAAPEPGSLALLTLSGLPVLGAIVRRNRVSLRRRRSA